MTKATPKKRAGVAGIVRYVQAIKRAQRVFINAVYAQAIKRAWRATKQGKNSERNEREKRRARWVPEMRHLKKSDVRVTWTDLEVT